MTIYSADMPMKVLHEIKLPGMGTVKHVSTSKDRHEMFIKYTSFTEPGKVFRVDT